MDPITTGAAGAAKLAAGLVAKKAAALGLGAAAASASVPFMLSTKADGGDNLTVNTTRLIEAVIIALVTGVLTTAGTVYVTVITIQHDLQSIAEKVTIIESRQKSFEDKVEAAFWAPVVGQGKERH